MAGGRGIGRSWRVAALATAALLAPPVATADDVVGRMGSVELRASELERALAAEGLADHRAALTLEELERLARNELMRGALLAEAKAKGWDRRPETAERVRRAQEQAVVADYMNSLARPPKDYPSEQQIREAYERERAAFTVPARYRVAQIYLPRGPDGAVTQLRASQLASEVRAGADFKELARRYSRHAPSAVGGGDLGWIAGSEVIPEMRPVLAQLRPGQVSAPVETAEGFHIVKLLAVQPERVRPLEEARPAIARALRLAEAQRRERVYLDRLAAETPATVDGVALGKVRDAAK